MDYKKLLFASTVLTGMLGLGAANNEKTAHADTIDSNSAVESNTEVAPQSNVITVKNTKATPAPVAEAPKAEASVVENATPVTETKQEAAPVVEKAEAQPVAEEKATQGQIQNQIDKETNHMNQDQNKVGQLENENQNLKDQIHKVDKEHQDKVDELGQNADKVAKPMQDKVDQMEQDQINAEKDKIQNDINHKKDELSQTQNNSAKTEQAIKDKKDELDKLNKNEQTSVMGSIVNNKELGAKKPYPVLDLNASQTGTIPTEKYKEYQQTLDKWHQENTGKVEIKNHQLTDKQAWELNLYLMDRVNETRRAHGQKELVANREMFDKVMRRAPEVAKNFTHDKENIYEIFGEGKWAGENIGTAGSSSDYADLIYSCLDIIDMMFNDDAGSGWGHRENFLIDHATLGYKETMQAGFGFAWSAKDNRWVLTFDVMSYEGGKNYANTLNGLYPITADQSKIDKLKAEIAQEEKKLEASRQKEKDLQKAIEDLEAKKKDIQFDKNKLNDKDKAVYEDYEAKLDKIYKQHELDYVKEVNEYGQKVAPLRGQYMDNDKEIQRLNKEIKQHKEKIADLKAQLKEEGNKPAPKPDNKPETKPDNKPKPENPGDGIIGNDGISKPVKPSKPNPKPENPGDGIIGNDGISKPVKPQNPNDNIDDEDRPPMKGDECDNDWDSPEDEIASDDTQTGNDNHHSGDPVVDGNVVSGNGNSSTGSTTGTASSTQGTKGHLVSSAKKYVVTPEVEAAEIIPTATKAANSETLPQTGSSKGETLAALGVMTVTMSSLLAVAAFRRRKEH